MDDSTQISRRHLLQAGGAAVVGAVFADFGAIASAKTATLSLRRSRFAPYVGQRVTLTPHRGPRLLGKLVAVEDLPTASLAGSEHAYALRFQTRTTPGLQREITSVQHPRFGTVKLLMTEGGSVDGGHDYVAVVNRVVPHTARG
jgi:hypothetical protein